MSILELFDRKIKSIIKLHAITAIAPLLLAGGCFYGYREVMAAINKQNEKEALVLLALQKQGLSGKLLKVVDEKLGSKVSPEIKVDVCNTILMMCNAKNIPVSIACGLIEVESQWNIKAVSSCGARGLTQVMPAYAKPYLRLERKSDNANELLNPTTSIIVGLSMLADLQAQYVEMGVPDTMTLALHSFYWGRSNTLTLLGKRDIRVNVPNMAYPLRVYSAAKYYKELGL